MNCKHIGIASITAEGGALCYREIVHASAAVLEKNAHPEISLHSFSFADFLAPGAREDGSWEELMIRSSRKLADSGAEFFICPANTNHIVFERVRDRVAIPWLHIASVVAERGAALGCRRVLLLGTKTTMQNPVYLPYLANLGIEMVLPDPSEQEELHRIIYDELVRGIVTAHSRTVLEKMIDRFESNEGCDSVILGCTELPLILGEQGTSMKVLDSTCLLAHGALAHSLGMPLSELEQLLDESRTEER